MAPGSSRYRKSRARGQKDTQVITRGESKAADLVGGGYEIYGRVFHSGRSLRRSGAGGNFLSHSPADYSSVGKTPNPSRRRPV